MQIKNKFFLRLFILSFIPFLILSLVAVYLFNQGIGQVISPGFENSLRNAEFLVENSLELYRIRFMNLIDILAKDSLTTEDIKYFDLILFVSQTDTISIKPLENPDYNRMFMEEAAFRASSFPEIISFEGRILVYQQIALNPTITPAPMLVVGQYLPPEFSAKAAEIITAKTEYGRLIVGSRKAFPTMSSGTSSIRFGISSIPCMVLPVQSPYAPSSEASNSSTPSACFSASHVTEKT